MCSGPGKASKRRQNIVCSRGVASRFLPKLPRLTRLPASGISFTSSPKMISAPITYGRYFITRSLLGLIVMGQGVDRD